MTPQSTVAAGEEVDSARLLVSRFPNLDALRTIALVMVLLFHQGLLPFGWAGVQIFFVLSGYLITRLLVRDRGQPVGTFFLGFYARRSLRLFPLYFLVVALLWLLVARGLDMGGVRAGLPYAATYTYNFFHASNAFQHSKLLSHFWSLCVEEQFYLAWPLLIYLCPPQRLRAALVAVVLLGPLLRLAGYWYLTLPGGPREPSMALYVLTSTHLDAFAAGAYASLYKLPQARRMLGWLSALVLVLGLSLITGGARGADGASLGWITLGYPVGLPAGYGFIWGYSLLNIWAALLVEQVARGDLSPRLLALPWLNYLGKISYGLYIFHFPIQSLLSKLMPAAPVALQLAAQCALTCAVASATFHFFESRFLRLKHHFVAGAGTRPVVTRATRA